MYGVLQAIMGAAMAYLVFLVHTLRKSKLIREEGRGRG